MPEILFSESFVNLLRKMEEFDLSTKSYEDETFLLPVSTPELNFVVSDLLFTDPESGEQIVVAKSGEKLPILQTKLKKKSSWNYAYKFRCLLFLTI